MKDVVVIKRFSDEQWDVEVYEWNEKLGGLRKKIEDAGEFALASEVEVEKHLTYVRSLYNIVKEEIDNEETGETPSSTFVYEPLPKPEYGTYVFKSPEELSSFVQYRILANHGIEIPIHTYAEEDYISVCYIREEMTDSEIEKARRLFVDEYDETSDISNNILCDVFGSRETSYTFLEREEIIYIHVPILKFLTNNK